MKKIEFKLTVAQILIVKRQYGEWLYQEESSLDDYFTANPVTLEFDVPSLWRTDIENAPRDGTYIYAIIECEDEIIFYLCGVWYRKIEYHLAGKKFEKSDITHWMPIPKIYDL